MDLNSLPDEMLTLILKKLAFSELNRLRKMNKRIDVLAKRAKLTGLPVDKVEISIGRITICVDEESLKFIDSRSLYMSTKYDCDETKKEELENFFKRIQCTQLVIDASETYHRKDVESLQNIDIVAFVKEHSQNLSKLREIHFTKVRFQQPLGSIIPPLKKLCPRFEVIEVHDCVMMNPIFTEKELANRPLKVIYLDAPKYHDDKFVFDDHMLSISVANCEHFLVLDEKARFTPAGVVNTHYLRESRRSKPLWH